MLIVGPVLVGLESPTRRVQALPENKDGIQGFSRSQVPLGLIKIRTLEDFGKFVLDVSDMARLESKVKPEETNVKWNQTKTLTVLLVVLFEPDDEFSPEVVGLGSRILADATTGPGFDCETGAGTDVIVGTTINRFKPLKELLCGRAGKSPFAELVPVQTEHFADIPKPFDMSRIMRKPMTFDISGRGVDRNADFTAEDSPRFLFLFFSGSIDHALGFQGNEMIRENGKLDDEVDDLVGIGFAQLEPLRVGIALDYLMRKDSGCEFVPKRSEFFMPFLLLD